MPSIHKNIEIKDKVAVVIFLTPEQYESLKLTAEALGCTISEAFSKMFEITGKWDIEFQKTIAEKVLKGFKEESKR